MRAKHNKHRVHQTERARRGFTLVELMLALAISAYVLMGFGRMFIQNNVALNSSKMQTLAQRWASDTMEDYKSMYFASVSTGTWTSPPRVLGDNKEFVRTVTITDLDETSELREIEVSVTWTELGEENEVSLVSYIADY